MMSMFLAGAMLALCCPVDSFPQVAASDVSPVTVSSNVAGGTVYVDSIEVGKTPVSCALDSGKHTVCLVSGELHDWNHYRECREIFVDGQERADVFFNVPLRIQILSEPYGATAVFRDSIVGTTPCVLETRAQKGSVALSKTGFENLVVMFDTSISLLFGKLESHRGDEHAGLYLEPERQGNNTPVLLAASGAVIAGVGAAYFKIRADNLYGEYKYSGNAATLSDVRRLDAASAVSLVVSQASLALLIYVLVGN